MPWPRPVPLIGDRTSAEQRRDDPRAWAFELPDRDALYAVIGARRDIRRFRPDPVEPELLERVLEAAHRAPSVGHSQPWRFLVIDDADTRQRAATMADRERLAQAALLTDDSGRRLTDLQLEGIREAPLGVVVCCDRRTPAAGVLGRSTFPDADLWSCACAIQNLWLAARAEGLGVGWVTLVRPGGAGRSAAPARRRRDARLALPRLAGRAAARRPASSGSAGPAAPPSPTSSCTAAGRTRTVASAALPPAAARSRRPSSGCATDADELLSPPSSLGILDRAVDRVLALRGDNCPVRDQAVGDAGPGGGRPRGHRARRLRLPRQSVTRDVLLAAVAGEALGVVTAEANRLDVGRGRRGGARRPGRRRARRQA